MVPRERGVGQRQRCNVQWKRRAPEQGGTPGARCVLQHKARVVQWRTSVEALSAGLAQSRWVQVQVLVTSCPVTNAVKLKYDQDN